MTQICFLAPPPFFTRLTQGSMPTAQNLEQSLSRPRHSKRSHHKLYSKAPTPSQSQADLSSYSQLRERATTVAVIESGCYGKRNLYWRALQVAAVKLPSSLPPIRSFLLCLDNNKLHPQPEEKSLDPFCAYQSNHKILNAISLSLNAIGKSH